MLAFLACCVASQENRVPLRPREMVSLLEEGKQQYNLVKMKTAMPSVGSCWKDAVASLHEGCQHLDDNTHSDIALEFANCFLQGAGLGRHECTTGDSGAKRNQVCLSKMSERAFIAYTEFFTHTQSMCFFIMSQVWHEETEKTIDRLSTSAADVARQLEASEEVQEELLSHQRKSVVIQQELLENGVTLGSMLHESKDSLNLIFSEFRESTLEQQRLLSMVFHHLSTLQSWIVGEVSWVDAIAFYLPSFTFVYFLTSAQRTASARIPGLLMLLLAGLTERFISYTLLRDGAEPTSFQPVDVLNERLRWWVWLVRRSAIGLYTLLLAVTLYRYRDREEVMHQLLEHIKKQNEQLLKHLNKEGIKVDLDGASLSSMFDSTDGVNGLGYMPVLTSSSSSLSGQVMTRTSSSSSGEAVTASLMESPVVSRLKPIPRTPTTTNGPASPLRRTFIGGIPTAQSAFKPIKENSLVNISEDNTSVEDQILVSSSASRPKARSKVLVKSESPANTRYNLRRSRNTSGSPALSS